MTAAQVHVIALIFTAAMLAAVMFIAWRTLGRPRHALVWAIALSLDAGERLADLAVRRLFGEQIVLQALLTGTAAVASALIAIGFVLRARPDLRMTPLAGAALAAGLLVAGLALALPAGGWREAPGLIVAALLLLVGAAHVSPSFHMSSVAERAAIAMLVLFAAIALGAALLGLIDGPVGQGVLPLHEILELLSPVALIGIGLLGVFLVAADLAERMRLLATSDMLTGIYNRRGFEESAERAIRNAQRQRQPLAVVVSDIDSFKAINDRFGHGAGDRALKHFAARLVRIVRRGDLIGRIGGEEFALLLVNTHAQDALEVVERIRRDIASVPVEGATKIRMTASFGVTGLRPGDTSLTALLSRADRALYKSKLEGRDRVTSAELDETALLAMS